MSVNAPPDVGQATAALAPTAGATTAPTAAAADDEQRAESRAHVAPHAAGADLAVVAQEVLLRAYQDGDDWDDLFDRLTPGELDRLRKLFPFMPPRAARHFAARFVIPAR